MPPRSSFRGFLRLSLVSVPVRGFTANKTTAEVRLNQLHKDCNNRIRYKKVCPEHGEVATDEIVSGFEHTKDQYVVIDPSEVQKLRKKSEKSVDIAGFIPADSLDPMYFSGRMYYLTPDGPAGQKPYQLLHEAMQSESLYAVGSAILSGREQMVAIRPVDGLLGMSVLTYAEKVRTSAEFTDEVADAKLTKDERKLTKTLVDASKLEDFDYSQYKDGYVGELRALIDLKIEGQEIVSAPDLEEPKVINLMEALKASVEGAKKAKTSRKASDKVKTKMAPSAKSRTAAKAKKKAG
ncbi:MAG: non-homologous end joining protein Ku [Gemmatimonadota bacterium]|nr:MAG: non-homologous end joining protein Ku [Gemmatimonadota bacterium]